MDSPAQVRFDDTNPTKEKAEFEESILADLKLLGILPNQALAVSGRPWVGTGGLQ